VLAWLAPMFRRRRPPADPVTIYLDGAPLPAGRGEPLAAALLAADKTILARSPKLHRPRGPSCFRGGCDGCLARVDGVPNIMTCLTPARGGERIDSQNVVGSRKADLLRVTDWFFARGLDHHHLMAGVPGLSDVMQSVARKVAGLGRLPSTVASPRPARRLEADVLVVGGGVTGVAAASRLCNGGAGLRVVLVDDGLTLGGALACAPPLAAELFAACPLVGATVLARSVAAGFYDGEVLLASGGEAILVRPRALLFAAGAHDGVLAFPGNDLPGVLSARALCRLAHAGILPDGPVAIVGEGFWAGELARALGDTPLFRFAPSAVVDVRGTAGVRAVTVRDAAAGGALATREVAVVALDLPGAPAFELAAQAGAATRADPALGYVVTTDDHGRAAERIWAAGECTGKPFDPIALRAEGERVGGHMVAALAT
jgi:sarcosine oxidase, subunit alpha